MRTYIPETYGHSRRRRAGQNASKPEDPAVQTFNQTEDRMFPSSFQRASQLDEARAAVHEENDLSESFRDVLSVLHHNPSPTTTNAKARFELDRRASHAQTRSHSRYAPRWFAGSLVRSFARSPVAPLVKAQSFRRFHGLLVRAGVGKSPGRGRDCFRARGNVPADGRCVVRSLLVGHPTRSPARPLTRSAFAPPTQGCIPGRRCSNGP